MIYRELRRRAKNILGPTLSICLAAYFCYHMVAGNHGTIAWRHLNTELAQARATLTALQSQQHTLEHRVKLLRPSSLCLDLLEEQLRKNLGYSRSNEVVILKENHKELRAE